ncbi:hypothetical protein J6590_099344 [Homalodisca vitripennis]|nr:hypothetical protein J6590_086155 [Homalodisca vitripennis]KAG8270384.1 hypothetical protein J6590_086156 [Homalodisca vitripennis]KAG8328894.1 hypothetical protein J6590_099343 [Homalodisca vitripennis]KAG8328895.1 hypothetical protein J6590_099344 [Homalodisca vitripennis]
MGRLQAIFCREVLGTLIAAVFVILASDHTQAIRWLKDGKVAGYLLSRSAGDADSGCIRDPS